MTALINADSVTLGDGITGPTGPISLEQFAAQKAGYKVTVVSGTTWDSMTAAQFAKYQVLIVGDPDCNITPSTATSNAATWTPVVMGKSGLNPLVGNRALVGTDPEDHYHFGGGGAPPTNPADPTTAGAEHLVQDGIAYAGGVAGATGIYFDTSCEDNGSDLSVLNSLSASHTGFTEDSDPPCGGSVQLIASNPAFATLTTANLEGWECSVHITFPTYPTDWQPLAVATDTSTHPTCGTDPLTKTEACGEAYVLVAGVGLVVASPDLSLAPAAGTDPAGGTHTVTATVTKGVGGPPISGTLVSFAITGQNAGVKGTCIPAACTTNASGKVSFTYPDTGGAGKDTINASATISGSVEHATASETWTGTPPPHLGNGMMLLGADGGLFAYGDRGFMSAAGFAGAPGPYTTPLGQVIDGPFVGVASNAARNGYWAVDTGGQVFTVGTAKYYGGLGAVKLNAPIVGIAATASGHGYWLVASDGGVFTFGDAHYYGGLGAVKLHTPIVGIAATASGNGYWLAGSDGGVFTFGDAVFHGSGAATPLHAPIVGIVATKDGGGYYLAGSDGGVFTYGDAKFYGSTAGVALHAPVVSMGLTSDGAGYWLIGGDGGVFTHGDAPFLLTSFHGVDGPLVALVKELRAPLIGGVS
jgi:hypothetical protein